MSMGKQLIYLLKILKAT